MPFCSKLKSAQKRRRERENAEKENSQQSTDSGFYNSEESETDFELGAPREITADDQSQNDQSTATDDFSPISPPKKPRMSQEEKNEYLENYISSRNSQFTCFATQNVLPHKTSTQGSSNKYPQ